MGWFDELTAVLGSRQAPERQARDGVNGHHASISEGAPEHPCVQAALQKVRRPSVTRRIQPTAISGDQPGSLLGRLASHYLKHLRWGRDGLEAWHPNVLYAIIHPPLTREQVQRRLTSLLHGTQRTFPGRPLKVVAYDMSGGQLAYITWAPHTQEITVTWHGSLPD